MAIGLKQIILGSVIAFAVNKILTVNSFIDKLKIELKQIFIDKVKIQQAAYKKLIFTIELVIINPVNKSVNIESIFIDVFLFKSKIGEAKTLQNFTIAAEKKTVIPISFEIDLLTVPANLFTAITEAIDQKNLLFNIQGKINFNEGTLNFKFLKTV
jgi:LEA14-like dessication related protein